MREIKFRGWLTDLKEMTYDPLIKITGSPSGVYLNGWLKNEYNQNPSIILMQHTGLKDENDKEIWEGDIVYWDDRGYTDDWGEVVITYAKGGFCFKGTEAHSISSWIETESHCFGEALLDVEIIGNIYENKELLNER